MKRTSILAVLLIAVAVNAQVAKILIPAGTPEDQAIQARPAWATRGGAVIGGNPGPDLSDGRFPQTAGLGRPSSAARHGESHGHDFNPLVGGDRYRRTLHRLRVEAGRSQAL